MFIKSKLDCQCIYGTIGAIVKGVMSGYNNLDKDTDEEHWEMMCWSLCYFLVHTVKL